MHLYEINAEIMRLTDEIEFDQETGEILCDIDSIEQQIMALQMEKKDDRLMKIIDRECAGEKTDLGIAVVSYRKSESLEITDAAAALK